jgi:hypothetical protein
MPIVYRKDFQSVRMAQRSNRAGGDFKPKVRAFYWCVGVGGGGGQSTAERAALPNALYNAV